MGPRREPHQRARLSSHAGLHQAHVRELLLQVCVQSQKPAHKTGDKAETRTARTWNAFGNAPCGWFPRHSGKTRVRSGQVGGGRAGQGFGPRPPPPSPPTQPRLKPQSGFRDSGDQLGAAVAVEDVPGPRSAEEHVRESHVTSAPGSRDNIGPMGPARGALRSGQTRHHVGRRHGRATWTSALPGEDTATPAKAGTARQTWLRPTGPPPETSPRPEGARAECSRGQTRGPVSDLEATRATPRRMRPKPGLCGRDCGAWPLPQVAGSVWLLPALYLHLF